MRENGSTKKDIIINIGKKQIRTLKKQRILGKIIKNPINQIKKLIESKTIISIVQSELPHLPLFSPSVTIRKNSTYRCLLWMWRTKTECYQLISDLKTKKDFEKEIKTRYRQYGELVDQDTIAFLLVDEHGRNTQSITKIADLQPDGDSTVVGKVLTISDPRTFKRKTGTPGKVINLEIADDTGACRLVLWNGDIDQVKNREIHPGTTVKIINGYTKRGYTGDLEINLGRWGLLGVEPKEVLSLKESSSTSYNEMTGVLVRKEATRAFFKDNGEFGFVTTVIVKTNDQEKHITVWDHCVKDLQVFKIGDTLTLKNVTTKQENGKTEYHLNGNGMIQKSS